MPSVDLYAVGDGMLLLDAVTLLPRLPLRLGSASGLVAESGVIEPLVPDLSILRRPFLSVAAALSSLSLSFSLGELSGEQAVTLLKEWTGLGSEGLRNDPDATCSSAMRDAEAAWGDCRISSTSAAATETGGGGGVDAMLSDDWHLPSATAA